MYKSDDSDLYILFLIENYFPLSDDLLLSVAKNRVNQMKYVLLLVMFLLLSCSQKEEIQRLQTLNKELSEKLSEQKIKLDNARKSEAKFRFLANKLEGIKATIHTNLGSIALKFYPKDAPLHVYSFVTRAESGFYNGTQFHRVIKGFMIQGGDPYTKKAPKNYAIHGQGGPIAMMPHEFNARKHTRGVLSTARTSDTSAGAGSQFFIMHGDNAGLDNQYTVFGEVTQGMEIVDKIANVSTNKSDHPNKPVIIKSIDVIKN